MACGRPAVASRLPGVAELLEESGAGLLVPPDSPGELAHAVARLVSEPATARKMGSQGRRFIETRYSWAKTAERVESVLLGAIHQS